VYYQFESALQRHRKKASGFREMAERDTAAVAHDRKLHPRQERNQSGKLVFDMHLAKELLRQYVKDGLDKVVKPSELQMTRNEYMEFDHKSTHIGLFRTVGLHAPVQVLLVVNKFQQ